MHDSALSNPTPIARRVPVSAPAKGVTLASTAKAESTRLLACQYRYVARLIERFCSTPGSRDHGGFIEADTACADTRNSIYDGFNLFAAYLLPAFPDHHGSVQLWQKLHAHLGFIKRRQREDGTVAMGLNGVGTAPEVGFTLPGACAICNLARGSDVPGSDRIAETFEQYIGRGAAAVRRYFPLTSNHRWTAYAGALAVVERHLPHPDNATVIDDILADGVDMDDVGLYLHERSPVYDNVANWGLLYLADYWERKDLYELVARNLRFTLAMMQPNGEAETLFSHRQDRGEANRLGGDYYVWRRMASMTGDAQFAAMAERRLREMERGTMHSHFVPLPVLLDDGRLPLTAVTAQPPGDAELFSNEGQIWRRRRGRVATTVAADMGGHFFEQTQGTWGGHVLSDAVLSYHHGSAIVDTVKLRWGTGTGGFRPARVQRIDDDAASLSYTDPGWDHLAHFRRPGQDGHRHVDVNQDAQLDVRWEDGALRVRVRVGGWTDIPVNLQVLVRATNRLTINGTTFAVDAGGVTYADGTAVVIHGPDGCDIRVEGLPASVHRMQLPDSRTIPGNAEKRCHRLVAALFTPVDFEFVLRPIEA